MAPRSHIDHMSGNNAAGDSLTVHMAMLLIINYSCWQLLKLCKAGVGSNVWRIDGVLNIQIPDHPLSHTIV